MKFNDPNIKVIDNKYYIAANSTYADDSVKVLNSCDTFGIFDRWGDIKQLGEEIHGIYHKGTRYISDLGLRVNNSRPLLLSSSIKEENDILSVDLTNPELESSGKGRRIPKGTLHISRHKAIRNGLCYENIELFNYGSEMAALDLALTFRGDFSDIFEVRGMKRKQKGTILPSEVREKMLVLRYQGLDGILRETRIRLDTPPLEIRHGSVAVYDVRLAPAQQVILSYSIFFQAGNEKGSGSIHEVFRFNGNSGSHLIASVFTSNEQFNHWLKRSETDLLSLLADTPSGKYPYAGVPWYNTAFGRDGIITALETLWIAPDIARDVLLYLARTQATAFSAYQDAEPGKILHETREGEMVETGEIPFKQYYGTIDATPLFIVLAGAYYKRSGDLRLMRQLWPHITAALKWIDEYGDIDKDGFVEYEQKNPDGLNNQGWKDSFDSISHDDGRLAQAPIALCEVQGYVYDAKQKASVIAEALGKPRYARQLHEEADALRERFNETFWDAGLNTYVLALDGDKHPCKVRSSNAGQALYSGIVDPEKAAALVRTLMGEELFSGWGVRTLGNGEVRYNPMSYHNGSVWPHDVALIARGMAAYGFRKEAAALLGGIFDASLFIELQRLPELFCGFKRRRGEGPTAYPVACSPQAWAVGSVYLLLEACLQVEVDALSKRICFCRPYLPGYLDTVSVKKLKAGGGHISLEVIKRSGQTSVLLLERPSGWTITEIK